MSATISLIRALLGDRCGSDSEARALLEAALIAEAEPLEHFALRLGIDLTTLCRSLAQLCGLPFLPAVPETIEGRAAMTRTDSIGSTRSLRAQYGDREVLFVAAGLADALRLGATVIDRPELAQRVCLVPPGMLRAALGRHASEALTDAARQGLARRWPFATAHLDLTLPRRIEFVGILALLVVLCALTPFGLAPVIVPLLAVLLLVPAGFRLAAALMPTDDGPAAPGLEDADLPHYTLLVPLHDEARMVPQLKAALSAIDYPPEKLQVIFAVEENSAATLAALKPLTADPRFEVIAVADSLPRTKPKALNYVLPFVRGELVVIYDAEDIPDRDQLRLAAARFAAEPGLDCLQAALTIDNADESWLTRQFAAEYAGLFGLVLPALGRFGLPLPLGGTSNHIRASALREVGGWDAFNVTEDADLGIRLARLRYRVDTLASATREEAPIKFRAWFNQRTRWQKGWMQTFLVHNLDPAGLVRDMGWRNFVAMQILIGGMILSAPLHSVFVVVLVLRLAGVGGAPFHLSDGWGWAQMLILVAGYGAAVLVSVLGLIRLRLYRLIPHQIFLPLYWFFVGLAAVNAAIQLLRRPHHWAKTEHGLTTKTRG